VILEIFSLPFFLNGTFVQNTATFCEIFSGENWQKPQKIVIITSTLGHCQNNHSKISMLAACLALQKDFPTKWKWKRNCCETIVTMSPHFSAIFLKQIGPFRWSM
jgi:hypothetical protein